MAKLPRKTQKIFCSKPTLEKQTSVFGTMKTSDKQYSTDVGTLQSNAAYEQGWKSATIASYKPFMEDFNTLNYINTSQLAYLFQQGIPEWDEATAYYKNSFCSYNGDLWKSLIDDNLNNTPLEGESWTLFTSGKKSGGGLELCDIGTALYVDETKGLRRRLNGSIMDITSNYQAFLTRLKEITTLYPNLVCTETEWQTTKTMSKLGQCGKFVYNYGADGTTVTSIRLPLVININGLVDMANAGLIKDESLPNITGGFGGLNTATYGAFKFETVTYKRAGGEVGTGGGVNFDASRVSSTYQDNAPVQQEAIQYPYFIQIATGSETENNIINDIELNNPFSLFDSKYSDHELNNLSWLKSEGQWNAKAVYTDAYDKLLKVYNGTETVEGLSVKLSTETYTDYDFVLNTANETFRLPLKTKLASGKAVVGNGMTLGVTNGTTNAGICGGTNAAAFNVNAYGSSVGVGGQTSSSLGNKTLGVTTDPTKSGMELSDSNLYLYYYVGETVQNANLIDAGRIGEQLATKTDMLQASGAGMPSNKYIDLTLGASGSTYTAPANGYYYLSSWATTTSAQQAIANGYYTVNNITTLNGAPLCSAINVSKGDNVYVEYMNINKRIFRFIYAKGEV